MGCASFFRGLVRKKTIDLGKVTDTKLARCLTTLDLTALGIGSTLGAGIYVVAGEVANKTAGPSVVISFLIAAIASFFAGLCYAEFGSRVPKTGSAYVYSYVTVGEFGAFVIGWNLILEYVIGTASVARAWTGYFDSLINDTIQHFWEEKMPIHVDTLSPYPDFFALGITLLLTVILAVGVKESSMVNNVFTAINLLVVVYVCICGAFKWNFGNWNLPGSANTTTNSTAAGIGAGGFFPFGVSGMLSGAATCFYAFVGFDCIATTGEEVINPQKAIPISIVLCLLACFIAYFGVSATITLMMPYYLLDPEAPLPKVFESAGWWVAKYVIALGAICGLSASLLGAMFPMPRIIYAMGSDGLLFKFFASVNKRFKTPLIATIVSGVLSGVMAMMFDLKALVDMMSIGTLLAYTLVAVSILILRYEMDRSPDGSIQQSVNPTENCSRFKTFFAPPNEHPNERTSQNATFFVFILCMLIIGLCTVLILLEPELLDFEWWALLLASTCGVLILLCIVIICRQPQNQTPVNFKVPLVPIIPTLSIFVNVYLMMKLSVLTWVRFGVWMVLGLIIYFAYGMWHSVEREENRYQQFNIQDDDVEDSSESGIVRSTESANQYGTVK